MVSRLPAIWQADPAGDCQARKRAYTLLVSAGLCKPDAVLGAGWDRLVELLDEAHYARYNFSTATKLIDVCQELKHHYGTSRLIAKARISAELDARLREFKQIGPVTARSFTREIRQSGMALPSLCCEQQNNSLKRVRLEFSNY